MRHLGPVGSLPIPVDKHLCIIQEREAYTMKQPSNRVRSQSAKHRSPQLKIEKLRVPEYSLDHFRINARRQPHRTIRALTRRPASVT